MKNICITQANQRAKQINSIGIGTFQIVVGRVIAFLALLRNLRKRFFGFCRTVLSFSSEAPVDLLSLCKWLLNKLENVRPNVHIKYSSKSKPSPANDWFT